MERQRGELENCQRGLVEMNELLQRKLAQKEYLQRALWQAEQSYAALRDQLAMHPAAKVENAALPPPRSAAPANGDGAGAFGRRNGAHGAGASQVSGSGKARASVAGKEPAYGIKPRALPAPPMEAPTPEAAPPPVSLSSTGGLLMSSAWIPPPPPNGGAMGAGGGACTRSCQQQQTVPRLVPSSGTTVDDLDQLSALLRKRQELSSRPRTAAAMGRNK